jgi:hypothetical protein
VEQRQYAVVRQLAADVDELAVPADTALVAYATADREVVPDPGEPG